MSAVHHPVVDVAVQALDPGPPPRVTDAGKRALVDALAALKSDAALPDAVADLVYFAAFLEVKERAPDAGAAILDVARTAIPFLQAQGVPLDDVVGGARAAKMDALLQNAESKVPLGQRGGGGAKWWQVRK